MNKPVFHPTSIDKLKLIEYQPISDERGFLNRLFCETTFHHLMQGKKIQQINQTLTIKKGTVRGFHFQFPPHAEIKIVSCLKGKVWDVAVDLRKGSPTFLHHHAELLTEDNHKSYLIPEGFAHGFQTLTNNCELLYFHTLEYNSLKEGALNVLDERLKINWPLPAKQLSVRDQNHPMIDKDFLGIEI